MPSIEITDDQRDRIEALRRELADAHAGGYASVTPPDVAAYLLDLADAVSDPDRLAEVDAADARGSFPRAELKAALTERNRRHADEAADAAMDLYSIAAAYDIAGRSNMTKGELVTAILDTVERRYTDPLAPVDLDLPREDGDVAAGAETDDGNAGDGAETDDGNAGDGAETDDEAETDGQLTAMLNLLETHRDKWREADGDARYEVELPDGSSETARTKDDVRATLFRHY